MSRTVPRSLKLLAEIVEGRIGLSRTAPLGGGAKSQRISDPARMRLGSHVLLRLCAATERRIAIGDAMRERVPVKR